MNAEESSSSVRRCQSCNSELELIQMIQIRFQVSLPPHVLSPLALCVLLQKNRLKQYLYAHMHGHAHTHTHTGQNGHNGQIAAYSHRPIKTLQETNKRSAL